MAMPEKKNNIMNFGDRMLYYMTQAYAPALTPTPPYPQESWDALETRLAYYITRGWTFT